MKVTGIIAEFNPFTNGHAHLVKTIKELTGTPVIAVMSGSFVQRGEPAFANKFLRAETAVAGGVDLILELPTCWSLRSAEHFAKGGITLLKATGVVDTLACGTEHPEFNFSACAAKISLSQSAIQTAIGSGKSYAQALKEAVPELPTEPNDILALEYTKAAGTLPIIYLPRKGKNYNDNNLDKFASASAVRKYWPRVIQAIPESTMNILFGKCNYDINMFWHLVQYRLRMMSPADIATATTTTEGLENLLKKSQNCLTWEEALNKCSTKRYPTSRIRRLLCQLSLCQERSMWEFAEPAYLRVLAFNDTGRKILKTMKETATLPIITKPETLYSTDVAATDLLASLQGQPVGLDFTTSPKYLH